MARLVNQLRYVLLTYATALRFWVWLVYFVVFIVPVALILANARDKGETGNDAATVPWLALAFTSFWLATLLGVPAPAQFMHYRARLMPGFALPHLLVVLAIALLAAVAIPVLFAAIEGTPLLDTIAVGSALFAVALPGIFSSVAYWVLPIVVISPMLFGYSPQQLEVQLSPLQSAALLIGAWVTIGYSMRRLISAREEDLVYQRALVESEKKRRDKRTDWHGQPPRSPVWRCSLPQWTISDYWHDRIGGFHEGAPVRVIRLLRHGNGTVPPELQAIGVLAVVLALPLLFTYAEISVDVTDPLVTIHLLPMLVGAILPGAYAVDHMSRRRPRLMHEIFLPLSREGLMDGLIGFSTWMLLLLWTAMNAVAMYFLWTVPGLEPSILRAATFLFLSAATSVAMFGLGLWTGLDDSIFERIFKGLCVVGLCGAVLLFWWFRRDEIGDAPFWLVGFLLLAFGLWLTTYARRQWLNLELG